MNILILDDSLSTRKILSRFLEPHGNVQACETMAAARQILEQEEIDLLLADISLPDGNGLELVSWARQQLPYQQRLRIIVISALIDQATACQTVLAGANDFIPKPVPREELLGRVQALQESIYCRLPHPWRVPQTCLTWEESGHHYIFHVASRQICSALTAREAVEAMQAYLVDHPAGLPVYPQLVQLFARPVKDAPVMEALSVE